MGDQRRRGGRGRSGRGGRIPRKGEAQSSASAQEEAFVSFPLEISGPIRVPGAVNAGTVTSVLQSTLDGELRQLAAFDALSQRAPEPALTSIRTEVERHREALTQLARDLEADLPGAPERALGVDANHEMTDALAAHVAARIGWQTLQQVAYTFGDKRIDRVTKPIVREKERHAAVLEAYALRLVSRALFREPEF